MVEGEVLFVEDIAQLFHISKNTIRRKTWREKSGIPLRKVGKHLCGLRPEIEKWFKGLNG
ncbi:MAG: excisionase [Candidatus Omnitrophica bacterium]|nr:excisionase [Candidatus Omnitrophota bacterium]